MEAHGPWQIRARIAVYRDPWIEVLRDDVLRPDGQPGTHAVVRMKPGVCVLPIDAEGRVYLTEEFHYAVGRVGLEGVSGGIEPGESPLDTARRELAEELGLEAQAWTDWGLVDPFTTIVDSPTRLFLARDLTFVPPRPEGTERIRRVCFPLSAAVGQVLSSQITHGPTCLLVLRAHLLGQG